MRTFTQAWASGELADALANCLPVIAVMAVIFTAACAIAYFGGGPR